MYNKLFTKILDSSIWLQPTPTRIVWLTFIATMDETGFVQFAGVGNVAHRALVSVEEAEAAISCLEGPDPESSDPEHDGRRVERVPGGWMVLNSEKHREMVTKAISRQKTRERVQKHRNASVTPCNGRVTPSEAEAEAEADPMEQEQESDGFQPSALIALWNNVTTPPLPKCIKPTKAREAHAKRRLLEHGPEWWRDVLKRINASAFLRGENERGWVASFDWLVSNEDNALKVLEGTYDNRPVQTVERSRAAVKPHYGDEWCYHEPRCNSREYHAVRARDEVEA